MVTVNTGPGIMAPDKPTMNEVTAIPARLSTLAPASMTTRWVFQSIEITPNTSAYV
jgi:hypothetical protein